jgi:hypothetical protein
MARASVSSALPRRPRLGPAGPCAAPVLYIVFGYTTVRDACGLHMPQIVRWTLRKNDVASVKQIMKALSPRPTAHPGRSKGRPDSAVRRPSQARHRPTGSPGAGDR